MNTLAPTLEAPAVVALAPSRLADIVQLLRPRMTSMVLLTVLFGGLLASVGPVPIALLYAVLGTGLAAASASVLNQAMEVDTDRRMRRCQKRPLVMGRLNVGEVTLFGGLLGVAGLAILLLTQTTFFPALLCSLTLLTYLGLYTPLKRLTTLNTLVGAIPGALPPVIGWTAIRGSFDAGALAVFLLLFFWQIPHFLAIAWMHRDDYSHAGLRMLPALDPTGRRTGTQAVLYAITLIPISLLPYLNGATNAIYALGAVLLGIYYSWTAIRFARDSARARPLLKASLVYLPSVLLLWWLCR